MEVSGWRLFQYPLFGNQLKKLTETVEQLSITQPDTYKEHPKTKLLATIHRYVTESIPRNPNAPEFRQGDTLGPETGTGFAQNFISAIASFFAFPPKIR